MPQFSYFIAGIREESEKRLWFVAHANKIGRYATKSPPGTFRGVHRDSFTSDANPTDLLGHPSHPGLPLCESEALPGEGGREKGGAVEQSGGASESLAHPLSPRLCGGNQRGLGTPGREVGEHEDGAGVADELGDGCEDVGTVADAEHEQHQRSLPGHREELSPDGGREASEPSRLSQTHFWTPCEWLPCRDGKWRPTKPGLSPLAHGVSGRVGRLRAAGNAICPEVAAEFIKSSMEATDL